MRWLVLAVGCASCALPPHPPRPTPSSGIAADLAYLASEHLRGRETGMAGGDSAAYFIADRYVRLGVGGAFDDRCASGSPCPEAYFQEFRVAGVRAENVIAWVEGTDPALRARYVVVGAHYDHLGRSTRGAMDPERGRAPRLGADDNASGTAALLELGRRLAARPAPTSVVLAHFDAEELGLRGSEEFVSDPPIPLGSVLLMINLDMVGRLRGHPLEVDGIAVPASLDGILATAATDRGIAIEFGEAIRGRSDHASFAGRGVPAVALFTGFHQDYHRVTDTVEKLDLPGLASIIDFTEAVVRSVGRVDESSVR